MKNLSYMIAVSLRMSADLREKLLKLANADRRSLTNYIRLVLEQHVAETEQKRRSA
jgi:predicted DNA-binding protein